MNGAPTRLVLVRHAEPSEDARGRCHGRLDVRLSPCGRRQAERLAETLERSALSALYTSPSRRAVETAAPLAAGRALAPVVDERLREIDFGELEGRGYDEIASTHPELYRRWMTAPTRLRFPGGESYAGLRRRALAATAAILERHAGETVAVVSHAGVLRAILADSLAMPASAIFRLDVDYATISIIDWIDDTPLVRLLNARGPIDPAGDGRGPSAVARTTAGSAP
jgi:alpha-ribazole phosphatase